jgi:hypothetical protein
MLQVRLSRHGYWFSLGQGAGNGEYKYPFNDPGCGQLPIHLNIRRSSPGVSHSHTIIMPLFIPLFVQLTPQSQSFNFNNPVLVEVQVPSEARVPFHDYRQVSEDIGGLSTLPYPLPGSSIRKRQLRVLYRIP